MSVLLGGNALERDGGRAYPRSTACWGARRAAGGVCMRVCVHARLCVRVRACIRESIAFLEVSFQPTPAQRCEFR